MPTLASSQQIDSAASDTSTLTSSAITVANGDVLVVKASGLGNNQLGTASGGSQTWTTQVSLNGTSSGFGCVTIATCTVSGSPGTVTASMSFAGGAGWHSMVVERWTGAVLAGSPVTFSAVASSGSAPSVTTPSVTAGSVLTWSNNDDSGSAATGRTYRTSATEDGIQDKHTSASFVAYYAYQSVPTTGTQIVGMTVPSSQFWALGGVEIKATGASVAAAFAAVGTLSATAVKIGTADFSGAGAFSFTVSTPARVTASLGGIGTLSALALAISAGPAVLPTYAIQLDDGTGTFPYDISSRLALSQGLTIQKGRSDERSTVSPSTLQLTLENLDGAFSYGTAASLAAYPSGFYDQQIRVTIGGVSRFCGYITDVTSSWPDGSDLNCMVTINASDALARLARRSLRSIAEQEILADSPSGLFMLSEATSALAAGDTSSNAIPPLFFNGTGTAPAFGATGPNTWDGFTVCSFVADQYLAGTVAITPQAVEFVIARNVAPTSVEQEVAFSSGIEVFIDTLGRVAVYDGVTGSLVCTSTILVVDGLFHHIAVSAPGTTWTLLIDGATAATGTGSTIATGTTSTLFVGFGATATIGAVAFWAASPSLARLAAHSTAVKSGFVTDSSNQRVARLAGYAGIASGAMALEAGAQTAVPAQKTSDASVLDAISTVVTSENGLAFIRGDGVLVFQNRTHRAAQTTPKWTIIQHDVGSDAAFTVDTQHLMNYVEVTSATGATQVVKDAASIAAHEQFPVKLDLLVATDAEALSAAQGLLAIYKQPQPRLPGVTIDLLTQTGSTFRAAALSLELSDRFRVTGLPSQTPGGTSVDLLVEGWSETLSATAWQMVLNTSNFATASSGSSGVGWVLDDTTYSVLGTTTVLT